MSSGVVLKLQTVDAIGMKGFSVYVYSCLLVYMKLRVNRKSFSEQYQLGIQMTKSIQGILVKYVRFFTDS